MKSLSAFLSLAHRHIRSNKFLPMPCRFHSSSTKSMVRFAYLGPSAAPCRVPSREAKPTSLPSEAKAPTTAPPLSACRHRYWDSRILFSAFHWRISSVLTSS